MLAALVEALRRADCTCTVVSDDMCEVVHGEARDGREARLELAFFLRAWAAQDARRAVEVVT